MAGKPYGESKTMPSSAPVTDNNTCAVYWEQNCWHSLVKQPKAIADGVSGEREPPLLESEKGPCEQL